MVCWLLRRKKSYWFVAWIYTSALWNRCFKWKCSCRFKCDAEDCLLSLNSYWTKRLSCCWHDNAAERSAIRRRSLSSLSWNCSQRLCAGFKETETEDDVERWHGHKYNGRIFKGERRRRRKDFGLRLKKKNDIGRSGEIDRKQTWLILNDWFSYPELATVVSVCIVDLRSCLYNHS